MTPTPGQAPDVEVVYAVAAAIISSASVPANLAAQIPDRDQKFVVHPHNARVEAHDKLLVGYPRSIYSDRPALQTVYPQVAAFAELASADTVENATKAIAEAMALEMSRKHANPGILFGFVLRRSDGSQPHGIIKADLDEEERFHMIVGDDGQWGWDAVSELLPPPKAHFAKFAIAPQPGGVGPTGIRDVVDNEAAAAYFLAALSLAVPKTSGTQARVATVALKAGYTCSTLPSMTGGRWPLVVGPTRLIPATRTAGHDGATVHLYRETAPATGAPGGPAVTLCGRHALSLGVEADLDVLGVDRDRLCGSCWRIAEGWLEPPRGADGEEQVVAWLVETVLKGGSAMINDAPSAGSVCCANASQVGSRCPSAGR